MLTIGTTGTIYVAVESQDGRKGIDGLAGVVRTVLGRDPASGDLFVFKNRRGDKLKILAWMGDGFALDLRRLEKGTFAFPSATSQELTLTTTQLAMILGGIELTQSHTHESGSNTSCENPPIPGSFSPRHASVMTWRCHQNTKSPPSASRSRNCSRTTPTSKPNSRKFSRSSVNFAAQSRSSKTPSPSS